VLKVDDFVRWSVDVPLLFGTSRDFFRVWGGPKVLLSWFDTAIKLESGVGDVTLASFEGHAYYVGGQGGIAVGYKYLFFAVELTLAQMIGSATASVGSDPALSHTTDLSGFVFYPTFGLIGEI